MIGKKDGTPKDLELPSILKCSLVGLKKKNKQQQQEQKPQFSSLPCKDCQDL